MSNDQNLILRAFIYKLSALLINLVLHNLLQFLDPLVNAPIALNPFAFPIHFHHRLVRFANILRVLQSLFQ